MRMGDGAVRTRRRLVLAAVMLGLAMLTAGCAATSSGATMSSGAAARPSRIVPPPTTGAADYQLGEAYAPPKGVTVVTRDSTSTPARGVYSICYVNGFQTQPGATWPGALVLRAASGRPITDPGWPDERLIDISTPAKRAAAARRIASTVRTCDRKGFRAVEFDNLDSYTRSKGRLTLADAEAFAKALVSDAHAAGLAAGQKNTAQLGARGRTTIGFDFAVSEECAAYDECRVFTKAYGTRVLDVEYTDDLHGTFAQVCARASTPRMTILRDRELVGPRHPAYVYRRC